MYVLGRRSSSSWLHDVSVMLQRYKVSYGLTMRLQNIALINRTSSKVEKRQLAPYCCCTICRNSVYERLWVYGGGTRDPNRMSIVVTRMEDLASEFSEIFRGWYTRTLTAEGGDPLPHPTPIPAYGRAPGASAPMLGPKPWSPQLFSRGFAPA